MNPKDIPAGKLLLVGSLVASLSAAAQWHVLSAIGNFLGNNSAAKGAWLFAAMLYNGLPMTLLVFLPYCIPIAVIACAVYVALLQFGMRSRSWVAVIVGVACQTPYIHFLNAAFLDHRSQIHWTPEIDATSGYALLGMTAASAALTWWWTRRMHAGTPDG